MTALSCHCPVTQAGYETDFFIGDAIATPAAEHPSSIRPAVFHTKLLRFDCHCFASCVLVYVIDVNAHFLVGIEPELGWEKCNIS